MQAARETVMGQSLLQNQLDGSVHVHRLAGGGGNGSLSGLWAVPSADSLSSNCQRACSRARGLEARTAWQYNWQAIEITEMS